MPVREEKVRRDSRLFAEMCAALAERGHGIQFRASGQSMGANIADGDDLIVAPVGQSDLRSGDVAFIQNLEGLRVHRVTRRRGTNGAVVTSSDTSRESDAPASRVFGKVIARHTNGTQESFTPLRTKLVHPVRTAIRRIVKAAELRLRRASFLLLGILFLAAAPSAFAQALTITNTASPTTIAAGASITYTQVVSNTSGHNVTNPITVTQTIPANTTFVSEADNGTGTWTCAQNAGVLTCTDNANFGNGSSNTFTMVFAVNAGTSVGTVISDTVTADGANSNPVSATANVTVGTNDLTMTQVASVSTIPTGSSYTYTEVAKNIGTATVPAGSVVVYQQTPPNTTFTSVTATNWTCTTPGNGNAGPITCTFNNALAANASTNSIVITVKVNTGTGAPAAGTTIVNSATVTSDSVDANPSNNTSITSVLVEPANTSDLSVSLNVSPTPVFISSALAYTINIQNLGPSTAAATTGLLTFTIPAGLTGVTATPPSGWTCTVGTNVTCNSAALAANATATVTINATAPATATTLTATASTSYGSDANANNNSDTAITVVQPIICATPGRDGSPATLGGIVNAYYPPVAGTLTPGATSVTLGAAQGSATAIAVGDLLLFIQMQDATISSSNSSSYGDGNPGDPGSGSTNVASSGVFEFVTATSALTTGGGSLSFVGTGPVISPSTTAGLLNTYVQAAATGTQGQATFQVIRVPQYMSTTLSSTLAALPWNGAVGGVLAIDVAGQLTLGGSTVSLDGAGFRGAGGRILAGTGTGKNTDYVTLSSNKANGSKGEGIAGTPRYLAPSTITTTTTATDTGVEGLPAGSYARGAPGNAGGGGTDGDPSGNTENAGGGGGGNGGTGGVGGYGWNTFGSSNSTNGGFGGVNFPATTSALVMGGAGGAGTTNDGSYYNSASDHSADCGNTCTGIYSSGGAGGGIVIIHAGSVIGTGTITANGLGTLSTDNDSTGGAGAGGSIEVFANSGSVAGLTVNAAGGNGGNAWPEQAPGGFPGNRHGPGGGGGGGVAILSGAATVNVAAGSNGYTNTQQDSFGSTPGTAGVSTTTHIITETPGTQSGAYCAGADLAVTNVGPAVTTAGSTITYTATVTNNGPLDAVNAVFTEAVPANTTFSAISTPAGWTCSTPAVGGTGIITCTNPLVTSGATAANFGISVKVNAGTTTGTQIVDTANITSGSPDPNLTNNTATATTTVSTATGADIATTMTSSSPTTVAGTNVTMTAVVTNQGPAAATNAAFSEAIPANTSFVSFTPPAGWTCFTPAVGATSGTISCLRSSFASGTTSTFPAVFQVIAGTAGGTVISATADAESATSDPNPSNNIATATTIVASSASQADLAITSAASPNPVSPGNNITYTQVLTNNGPGTVTNGTVTAVTFTDTIPTGTTLASFTPPAGWTCTNTAVGATGTITCTLNAGQTIPQGGTVNFPMSVKVNLATTSGTTITNTANVNVPCSATQDPNCANNSATTNVLVASPTQSDVSITKTASPEPVNQGTNLTYTIQVTNSGPAIAQNVVVSDPIPSQVTYLSASTSAGTCSFATATVTCNLGSMSVGSNVTITINATAGTFGSSTVTCNGVSVSSCNTATVTSSTSDPNAANNTSSAGSTIASPTSVDLSSAHVYIQPDGTVQLEWNTHEESRNLGFHVYREDETGRHRVNPSIIAGSALQLRGSKPQHAAKLYRWIDPQASASASYWIEDLDINGTRTMHGPYYPEYATAQSTVSMPALKARAAFERSPLLSQVRATPAVLPNVPLRPNVGRPVAPGSTLSYPHLNPANYSGVKISVEQEGWYHVTFAQLYAAGLDVNSDVRGLHLFAEGVEQPMLITGHPNGPVSPGDAIEFYGTGIDTPYSGTRIYWLVRVDGNPNRIATETSAANGSAAPASFPSSVVLEDRTTYFAALLNGENNDNFFGAIITTDPTDQNLTVTHSDPSGTNPVTLNVILQGAMDQQVHTVDVAFNGTSIGQMIFPNLVQYTQSFPLQPSLVRDGANTVTLTAQNGENDLSLVQNITLQYPHTYAADANWLRATAAAGDAVRITGFTNPQIRVFDITDPLNISECNAKVAADASAPGTYAVSATLPRSSATTTRTILAFSADQESAPVALEHHTPAYLSQQNAGADYVVIAHPDFVSNVNPLVRLRESQGHKVAVVTTEQIFDQYNYGERSPFAIRSYLQDAANKWQRKPQSVLLVGDASFDPRNYLGFGDLDFVPSRMIETAAFKTASDDWFTDFAQTGYATIPTGRLPVDTPADADLVVSKIVGYESGNAAGPWNAQAVVIADQNVDVDFTSAANTVAATVPASLQVNKILANTLDYNTARTQLLNALNGGSLIVNYDGHGAEQQWSFSNLFDNSDAAALSNGGRLPVYLVMDCLNGFFQDVYGPSLAESLLLAPNGGAVAVWASSGFTNQPPQATMNLSLMGQLAANPGTPLGQLLLAAKNGITDNDVRRTWLLFGDPAMKLQFVPAPANGKRVPIVPRPPVHFVAPKLPTGLCARNMDCAKGNQR